MAINTPDYIYTQNIALWTKVRDCVNGERSIKGKGTTYLREFYPGMSRDDPEKWRQLLEKTAEFPNVTSRLHAMVTGAMLRQSPSYRFPDALREEFEDNFGVNNSGILSLISEVLSEDIITGRTGILVDRDVNGQSIPFPRVYRAEDIIGTLEDYSSGQPEFTEVRLRETFTQSDANYDETEGERVRELGIDEEGNYFQRIWESEATVGLSPLSSTGTTNSYSVVFSELTDEEGRMYPLMNGQPLTFIPFWIANGCYEECRPILADVAEQNIHIYNKVTYTNWSYYVFNTVTYFVAGVNPDEARNFKLGGLWTANNTEANVTPLGGQADVLREGRELIGQAYETVAALGATMFSQQGGSNESAAALKIRFAPQSAVIGMEARAVSSSLTSVLRFAAQWYAGGVEQPDVDVEIHNITTPETVEPQALTAIISGVVQGIVPLEVLFYTLDKSNLLPSEFDPVEATDNIVNAEPVITTPVLPA